MHFIDMGTVVSNTATPKIDKQPNQSKRVYWGELAKSRDASDINTTMTSPGVYTRHGQGSVVLYPRPMNQLAANNFNRILSDGCDTAGEPAGHQGTDCICDGRGTGPNNNELRHDPSDPEYNRL